eukprot:SAG31_NODE_2476_length_5639_cov_8.703069_4_plen_97_part_00
MVDEVAGWSDNAWSWSSDSEEEHGSVLAAIMLDSDLEASIVGPDADESELIATPAPEMDALADRMSYLCIVGGEGTFLSLSVGGEDRLSEVLRLNH